MYFSLHLTRTQKFTTSFAENFKQFLFNQFCFSCRNNFALPTVYSHFQVKKSNWTEISEDLLEEYSPQLSHSVDVAVENVAGFVDVNESTYEWKSYELFETSKSSNGIWLW